MAIDAYKDVRPVGTHRRLALDEATKKRIQAAGYRHGQWLAWALWRLAKGVETALLIAGAFFVFAITLSLFRERTPDYGYYRPIIVITEFQEKILQADALRYLRAMGHTSPVIDGVADDNIDCPEQARCYYTKSVDGSGRFDERIVYVPLRKAGVK